MDSLAQLNAMRWDLDGDGAPAVANAADYAAAFPDRLASMGCPSGCSGYELTADLDFDTNSDGSADSGDAYWNAGSGWQPIGDQSSQFTATFEGNGHEIANLFISRDTTHNVGLFGYTGSSSDIRNVGLTDVSVSGSTHVGGLVGSSGGSITASYATGSVSGSVGGGLVGY